MKVFSNRTWDIHTGMGRMVAAHYICKKSVENPGINHSNQPASPDNAENPGIDDDNKRFTTDNTGNSVIIGRKDKDSHMGFIAQLKKKETRLAYRPNDAEILIAFDSGRSITFDDATTHMVVFGTTGSGKTSGVVLPCIDRLIAGGHGGLFIDIKGNLRAKILKLAEKYGRLINIVEYGTSPSAMKLNILSGMNRHRARCFFEVLVFHRYMDTNENGIWVMKGINQAADCVQLCLYLKAVDERSEPNLVLIQDMLDMPGIAHKLYQRFKKLVYDPKNQEHQRFVEAIESNRFHIFNKLDDTGRDAVTIEEQRTWNLQGVRMGLRAFLDAPGIRENFCAPGAPGFNLKSVVTDNTILTLWFARDAGGPAAILARTLITSYYEAVKTHGLFRTNNKKSFICIDEYPEVADLSNSENSDANYISQGREFQGPFIAISQSMAALVAKGQSYAAVESFVSNCNNRIMLYTDDPFTQAMAYRYDPNANLKELEPGEAFVTRYDSKSRRHCQGYETLQQAFESTKELIGVNQFEMPAANFTPQKQIGAFQLLEILKGKRRQRNKYSVNSPCTAEEGNMSKTAHPIVDEFPGLFSENVGEINIPAGWLAHVRHVFSAYSISGLKPAIVSMAIKDSTLVAFDEDYDPDEDRGESSARHERNRRPAFRQENCDALGMLNSLLKPTSQMCIICGASNVLNNPKSRQRMSRYENMPMCPDCLEKYSILPPLEIEPNMPEDDGDTDDDRDDDFTLPF